MVTVDISQIIEHPGGIQPFSVVVKPQEIGESESWVEGDISVTGQIVNAGSVFRLTGVISAKATLECSRCLNVFGQTVKFPFEEDLEVAMFGYPDEELDISESIRAALIFQEPMQPLCREDCKGLCPHCGCDRNQTECDCEKQSTDPRLAALKRLLGE
ncbi:MAG: DUF177 domain-containing protein [Veillonellaceae bacterium]|nr:DUF177 domain-containing protein [Veillonellaceae bacterium]